MSDREERFSQMFREHVAHVRGYARTLVADTHADDIVAATFRTAWRRLDDIPVLSQKAWLFGVARRHVLNHVRSEQRRSAMLDALGPLTHGPTVDLHHDHLDPVEHEALLQALQWMSEGDREILQLAAWYEMQPAEIATVLAIRPGTARARLHRARQRLDELLQATEPDATGSSGGAQ